MHDHDQEIIMALAEGTLDDAAAAAATAAIGSCPECTRDLELQRLALETLDAAPTVYMTATESSQLHRALREELVGATTPPAVSKRSFAWGRWLPAAGFAAVFLAAIVSIPSMFGGSDDDSAETTVFAATETTAASVETREAFEAPAAAADEASDGSPEEAMAGLDANTADDLEMAEAETTAAPETTEAPQATTTTAQPAPKSLTDVLPNYGPVAALDLDELLSLVIDNVEVAEYSAAARILDPTLETCVVGNTSPEIAPTLGLPSESEPLLVAIVTADTGEELLLVAYVPEDSEGTVFATQTLLGCEVIDVLP